MRTIIATTAAAMGLALAATPAAAQDQPGDKVNQLIVYGDDPCPPSTENEITVCARKAETERYRIPETLRGAELGDAKNQAWAERAKSFEYVGKSGTESCSPTGAGGFTGCTSALIEQAYAERGIDSSVRFGQLIEEEREKRLARIDAEAEAVEAAAQEREAENAEARARLEAQENDALTDGDADTPELEGEEIGDGVADVEATEPANTDYAVD